MAEEIPTAESIGSTAAGAATDITKFFGEFGKITSFELLAAKLFYIIVVLALAHVAVVIVHKIIENSLLRSQRISSKLKMSQSNVSILKKITGYVIYLIAITIIFQHFGIEVTAIIALLGIGGIAIAFASQETLSNLISGFVLMIDRPFEIGDRISLDGSENRTGDVVDIGLRSTRIKTEQNVYLTIPNAEFAKRDIYNFTIKDPTFRAYLPIGIAYESDYKKAKKAIMEAVKESPYVIQEKNNTVLLRGFGESSVDLELRVWVKDARKRNLARSDIYERIIDSFADYGIEIPYKKVVSFQASDVYKGKLHYFPAGPKKEIKLGKPKGKTGKKPKVENSKAGSVKLDAHHL